MKKLVVVVVLVAFAVLAWRFWPRDDGRPAPYFGYVESETLELAAQRAGRIVRVEVERGADVAAGATLFRLDDDAERTAVDEARARHSRARAELDDLGAARRRPEEIEGLEARRRQAEAALELSRRELDRQEQLAAQRVTTEAALDRARTTAERDADALAEVEREIDAARLPGREHELEAAVAEVEALGAALHAAEIALAERVVLAPRAGRVLDVVRRAGEVVAAGEAVVRLLPPEDVFVRFYVPQAAIARLDHGATVALACDGCPDDLEATVRFIASEAEFTPPVIFSREERAKLVFLVEAHPLRPSAALKPGLPVEVRPR